MVMDCPGYSKEFDPNSIFRKILVPIDFSPESRRALITACETRRHFGSEIHVFTVTNFGQPSALRGFSVQCSHEDGEREARERLEHFGSTICNGMPCLLRNATFGTDVIHGVVDAAKESGATMVIMGIHPKHSLFRTRAEKILRSLDIRVMVLQGTEEFARAAPAAAE